MRSITYGNGTENVLHELTDITLDSKSYFCNPYHSWKKGTVENIIGIIRRSYPKKTDWKNVSQWDLNKVMYFINNRPMKRLGFKKLQLGADFSPISHWRVFFLPHFNPPQIYGLLYKTGSNAVYNRNVMCHADIIVNYMTIV